jgi:HEAT repeat protein
MRQIACVLVVVACGCASLREEVQLRQRAEAVVAGALESPSPALREQAARVAADVADPLLDQSLGAHLGDPSPVVRAMAAAALVRDNPRAAAVLREALDGPDSVARVVALGAIGVLPEAPARLAKLAVDADPRVRERACDAIADTRVPDASALLDQLAHDPDPGVRGRALGALARLGDHEALGLATQALDDPSLPVRLAALGALVRLGRDEIGPRLLALAGGGRDRFVALRAAVQLSRSGRLGAALPAVIAAANDRDTSVRGAAMNAASSLGSAGADIALAHLRDPDLDVRLAAARALIATGHGDAARNTLIGALSTPRRLDAAFDLARLGDTRGVVTLQTAAKTPNALLRRAAIALLSPLPVGQDTLVTALDDSDVCIRLDAAATVLRRLVRTP